MSLATDSRTLSHRPPPPLLAEPEPRWLDGPLALAPLLLRAGELRALLAVGAPGYAARNSLLLDVDLLGQTLLIDPPCPPLPQPLPGRLALSTRIDGGALDFAAEVEEDTEFEGEPALRLRWPSRARYLQRRSAYRLSIPREITVRSALFQDRRGPGTPLFSGTLVDLSRHGAAALVPSSTPVREGDLIVCAIRIAELEISAEAQVRSRIGNLDRLRMGLQFERLSAVSAERLSAVVARLERSLLRQAAERRTRLGL